MAGSRYSGMFVVKNQEKIINFYTNMEIYKPAYAIKLSAKNFSFEDNRKTVPLYIAFCI